MRAPHLLLLLASAAAVTGLVVACQDGDEYVYTAQRWNADQGCLEDYKPIETVPGNDVSSRCPASCISVDPDLFVTTLCGPVPSVASTVDPATSPCKEALAAAAKGLACSAAGASGTDGGDEGGSDDGGDEGGEPDASPSPADASDAG